MTEPSHTAANDQTFLVAKGRGRSMHILSYRWKQLIFCAARLCAACLLASAAQAQQSVPDSVKPQTPVSKERGELYAAPPTFVVKPVARDEEIRTRLQSVLEATGWFIEPMVRVDEGIVG